MLDCFLCTHYDIPVCQISVIVTFLLKKNNTNTVSESLTYVYVGKTSNLRLTYKSKQCCNTYNHKEVNGIILKKTRKIFFFKSKTIELWHFSHVYWQHMEHYYILYLSQKLLKIIVLSKYHVFILTNYDKNWRGSDIFRNLFVGYILGPVRAFMMPRCRFGWCSFS